MTHDIDALLRLAQETAAAGALVPQQGLASPLLVASTPGIHDALVELVSSLW
jgi:hypothetical protein